MVANNGNHGSDHGFGTVALLAGGAVNGRRVFADWPGLRPENLYEERDLRAATDLRSVFKGVLREHLAVPDAIIDRDVFPDSASAKLLKGLIKSARLLDREAARRERLKRGSALEVGAEPDGHPRLGPGSGPKSIAK